MSPSSHGFLVMDASLKVIYANAEAIHILVYPENPQKVKSLDSLLAEKIRTVLLKQPSSPKAGFVAEVRSGRRRTCVAHFLLILTRRILGGQESLAIQFERTRQVTLNGSQIAERFNLTPREQQTLEYLIQGLTSKEIADPNAYQRQYSESLSQADHGENGGHDPIGNRWHAVRGQTIGRRLGSLEAWVCSQFELIPLENSIHA